MIDNRNCTLFNDQFQPQIEFITFLDVSNSSQLLQILS